MLAGAGLPGSAPAALPGDLADGLSELYRGVSPAVVRVVSHRAVMRTAATPSGFAQSAAMRRLVASGVVVDAHGCVVTTDRAAQPGDSVVVHFPDGRRMDARFVGQNSDIHISVLQLVGDQSFPWLAPPARPLRQLPEWVAAVAYGSWSQENLRGPALTLAQGDAAIRERVRCADSTAVVWRFRVPLYPGNAGGALLSLDGEWLGLITGVAAGDAPGAGTSEEGVIVPADLVARAVREIESGGRTAPSGFLGVRTYRRPITAGDSLWRGVGVIVSDVLAGGPAEQSGIHPGDVILRFGDMAVTDAAQLTELVRTAPPGSPVQIEILRAGEPRSLRVLVGDLAGGETALARWREAGAQRSLLEREIHQAEQRLQLLRRRLEGLDAPPGEAPAGGRPRRGSVRS
ncbi:MAG: serine protease [Candidatus Eisenbacteria bacterium]|uniref:Serine protease n=1 Tax=Eiseniibacteriota bacterium TaxID=2212470 RepID=A0A937XAR8_UNCEI|nr:serine protease [Candidatus Eisenbacteria bacterium]